MSVDSTGISVGSGRKEICHRFEPVGSRHPELAAYVMLTHITMSCLVKTTLQSASHMLPIPIKVCLKEGITCPLQGKSDGIFGSYNVPVPIELCTWPMAVPTFTLVTAAFIFLIGASSVN